MDAGGGQLVILSWAGPRRSRFGGCVPPVWPDAGGAADWPGAGGAGGENPLLAAAGLGLVLVELAPAERAAVFWAALVGAGAAALAGTLVGP
jgi:hypothetical protein